MPSLTQLILTICGLVTPGLFLILDDRKLAGHIAAQFFYAETFIGLVLGLLYFALLRRSLDRVARSAIFVTVAMPLTFFVGLRPLMASALVAGNMAHFGQLHGIASVLFLVACVSAGVLVWRAGLTHPAK